MKYITSVTSKKTEECFLCTKPSENRDEENFIVHRGEKCFIMLNTFPYNTGHLLVAPYLHKPNLTDLDERELFDLIKCVSLSLKLISEAYRPDGFNVGINIGRVAGAGLEGHVHVHIVPRWAGDTNFMSIISKTKVMPELLEDTYFKLKKALVKVLL